ncbi:hypothetical protein Y032_0204g1872 [Ancylostoma ceylanicum]|uniref:adenosylmethionine decarboxylase n=2 Tax=Ancylostoma ceylanicum TaxID=53326 RepID=A0A016SMN9_9BILA|nr:hypothetical protein Y032_0204g1872 [Ancylostoma ceylanicum]
MPDENTVLLKKIHGLRVRFLSVAAAESRRDLLDPFSKRYTDCACGFLEGPTSPKSQWVQRCRSFFVLSFLTPGTIPRFLLCRKSIAIRERGFDSIQEDCMGPDIETLILVLYREPVKKNKMSAKVDSCVSQTKPHEEQAPVEEYFFEGAEKLLELWFGNRSPKTGSLRLIPRYELDAMLDIARCKVLHSAHTDHIDSYVLSESSLFVSERRLILKTCGSTRLLAALPTIIQLAKDYGGFDQVVSVYYSRKNFLRPELQPEEHRSFDAEVEYLDSFFQDGHAYCMGSLKQDRWYLYTYHVPQPVTKLADHTLEILMTDLDEDVLHTFTKDACENGKDCTERAGINRIVPKGTLIHEELFDPCGYSMNAFLPDSDHYATIHVTPEKEFSFASFETNQDLVCLYKQTKEVLKCFRPGKLLMTVFANDSSTKGRDAQQQLWDRELPGYKRTNVQFVRLETETLVYAHFVRKDGTESSSDEDDGALSE